MPHNEPIPFLFEEVRETLLEAIALEDPNVKDRPYIALIDRLATVGLSAADLSYFEHAERMNENAEKLHSALAELPELVKMSYAYQYIVNGNKASCTYYFAKLLLVLVANRKTPSISPGLRNALQIATDSAREAYAQWSVALKLAEEAAVSA